MNIADVALSFVISCYASLVIGRFLIFFQDIQRMRDAVMGIVAQWGNMCVQMNEYEIKGRLLWTLTPYAMAIKRQGHFEASVEAFHLDSKFQEDVLSLWRRAKSARTPDAFTEAAGTGLYPIQQTTMGAIDALSPSYLAVLFGESITRWLGNTIPCFRIKK